MPSDPTSLLTTEEASGLLGLVFGPTMPEAIAWAEMDEQGQLRCLANATADFNSVRWKGRDRISGQTHRWPRCSHRYPNAVITDRAGEDTSAEHTPFMPRAIRMAMAAQAAFHAACELGYIDGTRIAQAAAQGIVSQGGGGMSESIDRMTAMSAWSRLCLKAQQLAEPFVARSAEGV
jgi:hypothetical protein